ncbi:glycoside hydrolase [Desarmillaria tabescens]|uniref:alpha-L-fucosidase n=1 Tax=Armillaria tabescens TaxID=1929756 RepID=A0AA39JLR6_ARMTA|nr:glycoside hydrolase [Desarmillaria tabescens]KAK0442753.1 glycoside hydrolase [Desarmillaria tabescens]
MHRILLLCFAGVVAGLQTNVDLTPYLNNKAASTDGQLASFDGHNSKLTIDQYALPNFSDLATNDNINCSGQIIGVPPGKYHSFNFLGATDGTSYVNGEFMALYDDNTTEFLGFVVAPWWLQNPSNGPITAPFLNMGLSNGTTCRNYNISRMFTFQHHTDNSKVLTGVVLPRDTGTSQLTGVVSIHVFAITLISADMPPSVRRPSLYVQNVRSTTKFQTLDGNEIQLFEITLNNFAPSTAGAEAWITHDMSIVVASNSLETMIPGTIRRLRGGDQARFLVGVVNKDSIKPGTPISDVQVLIDGRPVGNQWDAIAGIPDFYPGDDSLMTHESAEWFDNAKFGLFVHWGIYSVPAWTVRDAVRRMVITTKHHDGFALFDTGNSSNRNSLLHGPNRNCTLEYVDANGPNLVFLIVPQLYFSLPEWFNPAFAKYGHADGGDDLYHRRDAEETPGYNILQRTGFAGGLAQNAYNSSEHEPYTGYIEVDDFLQDIMRPQMEALFYQFYQYETDILWCDIGGPTVFPDIGRGGIYSCLSMLNQEMVAPRWFNWAKGNGRQVITNARCGANYSDFGNCENGNRVKVLIPTRMVIIKIPPMLITGMRQWQLSHRYWSYSKWNGRVPIEDFLAQSWGMAQVCVKSQSSVRDGIHYLSYPSRGEAIYDTQYWYVTAEEDDLRFVSLSVPEFIPWLSPYQTTKPDAFYIISLSYPINGTLRSVSPLPLKDGDVATFLGPNQSPKELAWSWSENGVFELVADEEVLAMVQDAWAFKITYTRRIDQMNHSALPNE